MEKPRVLTMDKSQSLPPEVWVIVMQFLNLSSLSTFTRVSKACHDSLTTTMVIRAALITGTKESNKTMAELYKYTYANSIHIPSPHRLLRLCTGKKCEFCFCALGRDSKFVHQWSFGCFACWDCTSSSTLSSRSALAQSLSRCWNATTIKYKSNSDRYDAVLHHPRNAISKFSPEDWARYGGQLKRCYVWREHQSVAAYGGGGNTAEKIGPLISWDDIDGIVSYMGRANNSDECNQKIDEYLEGILDVPTVEEYGEFNHAYSTAKKELENRMAKLRLEDRRAREEKKRRRRD